MAIFKVPKSPSRSIINIDNFWGVDLTNSPGNVSINQSPNAENMIRSVPNKVRKSMGYYLVDTYPAQINGFHDYEDDTIIHAGTVYYLNNSSTVLYSSGNDAKSVSWQFEDNLFIADGLKLLKYDGSTLAPAENDSYIPTLTIAKAPSGGGTEFEPLNLIQPGFTETFLGTTSDTDYNMSFDGLDATTVTAKKLDSNGDWIDLVENTDFTVDRTNGIVSFTVAPGESPITGEDNVSITAYRTVSGYSDRINKCDIGIPFGVNGAQDRLFLAGNSDFPNQDWFSQQYDPTYFGDTNYSRLGSKRSAIVCYSIVNNYLAAHKDSEEREQNIIIRQGDLIDSQPAFPINNSLHGVGAVSKHAVGYLAVEPLFFTGEGVFAITAQDITGEKYSQNRSFYLDGQLLSEPNKESAYSCIYRNMYVLALNGSLYILDGEQPLPTASGEPYSTRQYVAFYRSNVDARVIRSKEDVMTFGNSQGQVFTFYTDEDDADSYNDNGDAITCCWETPDLDGKLFYKNKSFKHISVRLQSAIATSISIYVNRKSIWTLIKSDETTARYLDFSQINFAKWSYSTDVSQRVVSTKLRIKKVDKARFKFENTKLAEPFGIFNVALEYTETGNYKGG